jgi:hypothetical protein
MNTLPKYKEFKSTCDYMQDLSKIMGKAQQAYIDTQEHYWHVGLMIDGQKIVSQKLTGELADKKFMLDFAIHLFHTPWGTINIEDKSPEKVFNEIDYLSQIALSRPEFASNDTTSYDTEQAEAIIRLFSTMHETFKTIKNNTTASTTSPILLFPHHFDLSLVTFIKEDDEHQVAFGLSTGDEAIEEPYLYVLTGPYHTTVEKLEKPDFLKVETEAFNGLLARISSITDISESASHIAGFHTSLIAALKE